ncbi:MAG: RNase adapter RapZ [Defluviitaleaceae bacterium]|nr:RNase adapter RapZ [Defluviitaleaceae bacterium]
MRIVIVTGMSGAGKTTALKIFEDAGFYCVDNLPPAFMADFAQFCIKRDMGISQVALGIDIRGGSMFDDFAYGLEDLENLAEMSVEYSILFLDSANEVLMKRYKETRHLHPLAKNDLISVGIAKERALLEDLREKSTYIVDTSRILPRQLKEKILHIFTDQCNTGRLMINILSFGFKHNTPDESDLVFDVRFLPNPFYDPVLKPMTGLEKPVQDFVMGHDVSVRFLESLLAMLQFLIPHYVAEGKNQLIISIGCTGGQHRSVTLAQELGNSLIMQNYRVTIHHRDINHAGRGTATMA